MTELDILNAALVKAKAFLEAKNGEGASQISSTLTV